MPLTTEEKTALDELLRNQDVETIADLSGKVLSKYSEESKEFMDLCENNSFLTNQWKKFLRDKGYPAFAIVGLDKKNYSPFKQLLGIWFLSQNELNKACQYGVFEALDQRLILKLNELRKLPEESDADQQIAAQISSDCQMIANLYWTPGCVRASEYLLAMANEYAAFADERASMARGYYLQALEHLILGMYLMMQEESEALIKVIYQGKGLIQGHYNKFRKSRPEPFYR